MERDPHFMKEGNLMDDPDIYEAMHLMYGPILDEYNKAIDPTGLLLFVLASVIYHSPWLIKSSLESLDIRSR